uniref:Uncharacterized protein n=1 Tax=Erpetoichthys calabaricus TaxID=27687 RepID=A0A8C4X6I1_ERPCA
LYAHPVTSPKAQQYPSDFYNSGQLFCKFCQHTIDWTRKDTCNDHVKSKTHLKNKAKLRLKVASIQSDILLEKMTKMYPFFIKHCKQGGALPKNDMSNYTPDYSTLVNSMKCQASY